MFVGYDSIVIGRGVHLVYRAIIFVGSPPVSALRQRNLLYKMLTAGLLLQAKLRQGGSNL